MPQTYIKWLGGVYTARPDTDLVLIRILVFANVRQALIFVKDVMFSTWSSLFGNTAGMKFITHTFIIIFILLRSLVTGQTKNGHYTSIEAIYGQKFLAHNTLNGQLNTLDRIKFGGSLSYVGIGISGDVVVERSDWFNHFGNIYYTQIIPQEIQLNDTLNTHITGFNFGFTVYAIECFPKQSPFNVVVSLGANTGRLRMYGNTYTTQKNPYFSPKLRVAPVITFMKLRLGLTIEYEYDVSRKNWRKTNFSNSEKINLAKTSNTGLTLLASVGYVLKSTKPKHPKSGIKTN